MLSKEFFEDYPLYRKYPCAELPASDKPLASFVPPIKRSCLSCQDKTTWKPTTEYLKNLSLAAIDDRQILVATLFFPKHAGKSKRILLSLISVRLGQRSSNFPCPLLRRTRGGICNEGGAVSALVN